MIFVGRKRQFGVKKGCFGVKKGDLGSKRGKQGTNKVILGQNRQKTNIWSKKIPAHGYIWTPNFDPPENVKDDASPVSENVKDDASPVSERVKDDASPVFESVKTLKTLFGVEIGR